MPHTNSATSDNLERWLAKIALAQSLYGHFYVEHNHGHHIKVATPHDPASARFGESFWMFLPSIVVGGLKSAWGIETARLRRQGKTVLSPANNILQAWALSAALYTIVTVTFG